MKKSQQINFSPFFFKEKVSKLNFEVRWGPDFRHDIAFLSGYLHDATFTCRDLAFRNGILKIKFWRDCWELRGCDIRGKSDSDLLLSATALLSVVGVQRVSWSILQNDGWRREKMGAKELMVDSIDTGPVLATQGSDILSEDSRILEITGRFWQLSIVVKELESKILLQDRTRPS